MAKKLAALPILNSSGASKKPAGLLILNSGASNGASKNLAALVTALFTSNFTLKYLTVNYFSNFELEMDGSFIII